MPFFLFHSSLSIPLFLFSSSFSLSPLLSTALVRTYAIPIISFLLCRFCPPNAKQFSKHQQNTQTIAEKLALYFICFYCDTYNARAIPSIPSKQLYFSNIFVCFFVHFERFCAISSGWCLRAHEHRCQKYNQHCIKWLSNCSMTAWKQRIPINGRVPVPRNGSKDACQLSGGGGRLCNGYIENRLAWFHQLETITNYVLLAVANSVRSKRACSCIGMCLVGTSDCCQQNVAVFPMPGLPWPSFAGPASAIRCLQLIDAQKKPFYPVCLPYITCHPKFIFHHDLVQILKSNASIQLTTKQEWQHRKTNAPTVHMHSYNGQPGKANRNTHRSHKLSSSNIFMCCILVECISIVRTARVCH